MPDAATTRFGRFHAAALEDLSALAHLNREETFAVRLGGLSACALGAEQGREALAVLLDEGCAADFAEDVLIQMGVYLGYPAIRQWLACLAEAADEAQARPPLPARSDDRRHSEGVAVYSQLNPEAYGNITQAFGGFADSVVEGTFRSFGDLYAQSALPLNQRQLANVTGLAVLGNAAPQLRFHFGAALRVGVTQAQLIDAIAWVQFFKGAPAAYNAMMELKASLAAGSEATPGYD